MTSGDVLDRLHRLRGLGLRKGTAGLAKPTRPASAPRTDELPGQEVVTPFGPAWVFTQRYRLSEYPDLGHLLQASPDAFAGLGRDPGLAGLSVPAVAFIDTETTGLSIGTDTYTFLIGVGTYEPGDEPDEAAGEVEAGMPDNFVVRQFFMRHPGEERAQLHLVEETLGACTGVISFNGRAFDMPLLFNRFTLAGLLSMPLAGALHLDLLPPARRLWRARLTSCALSQLERDILGVQRSADDVPGWMIPGIYRDYYRTGTGADLVGRVFYHNLEDIRSMARLAGHMVRLFELAHLERHLEELHPLDCVSLGRCYC
jgi:uncharacterized protein